MVQVIDCKFEQPFIMFIAAKSIAEELEQPERTAAIMADFELRKKRELDHRKAIPLRMNVAEPHDIDDLYLEDEGGGRA